ncbi:APC family permease [Fluviicola taffensis]|uniref:Amino acid/polyamine/organocation transporter, APC superfamily n=1 Tax=Fluviicola taffensis (strain DSM 16823 / NCIMB 13979 / RW262) TaxID=755732 RepID=F2IBY7_FLUTR|nr:amino acid permease [Fluviicola taffensis]AEA42215.1 amino acid/polyamine/organocation transporter, APC superfamily [Fluviicola taffensis DSM 16823]
MEENNTKKSLGLLDATFLVAGSMIGSGIFIVSAEMSRDLGSSGWLLFTWLITGVITLFGALSYGELAAMFPKAGGQFVYIREAWGKLPAFLYGWTTFAVIQTGVIAAVAVAFGKFAGVFFPVLVDQTILEYGSIKINGANFVGVGTILILTLLNVRGINYGKIIQAVFTSSKLIALAVLIVAGIVVGFSSGFFDENFQNMWEASSIKKAEDGSWLSAVDLSTVGLMIVLSTTIINSLFSSDAWNNVTFIAGDIRNPEKNLPRSLFLGTFIVTILYILANVSYLGLLPLHGSPFEGDFVYTKEAVQSTGIQFASSDRVGTSAAYMLFGNVANYLMAILIMISTFGCNNGIIMAGSRLFYAMSKDGLFFQKASRINRFGVPAWAMWIQSLWAIALCFSGSYGILIKFATFGSMIFYIVTILGLFKLRRTMPDAVRPYKAFGYPVIPFLYLVFATVICVSLTIFTFWDTFGSIVLILAGIPIYYLVFKKKESSN